MAAFNWYPLICHPTVVSTFASPHEPTLQPRACKRASASPARLTAFQDGFRITHKLLIFKGVRESLRLFANAQKNKINLCFMDRMVQIVNDMKNKAKQLTNRP
jgi:hypothetical protein